MKKVFLLILNWERRDETLECLASLKKLNTKGIELNVVVIDNASREDNKELKNYKTKKFIYYYLQNKKNLGFAAGNNSGMRFALRNKADYVMLLNNDTYVDKNLVQELLKPFSQDKKVAVTSPKIYFAKGFEFHKDRYKKSELGNVLWYAGGDIDWANVFGVNVGVDELDNGQYDKPREIDFATGACVMFSRKALKKAGLFDWKYFMYFEDLDLSYRIKKKRMKIIYVPDAKLWHKVAQSSGIGSDLNDYFITRNRLIFGLRYAGIRTRFALIREAVRFLYKGRTWQKQGVIDYMLSNLGKGSWQNSKKK